MKCLCNNYRASVHSTDMFPVGTEVGVKVDPFDIQIMKKPELKMRRLFRLKNRKILAYPYLFWAMSFYHYSSAHDLVLWTHRQNGSFN